jgi:naphthalene 1,2-dioxygenase system ferredoxin subunit
VTVAGREIAVYTVGSEVYASDNLCTHGNARLCDGFLEGHEIECPLHQGRFDVRDGRPLCDPVTVPVRVYPVRVEGGRVYIGIEGDALG